MHTLDFAALKKQERWRYTDLSLLASLPNSEPLAVDIKAAIATHRLLEAHVLLVVVDGVYQSTLSDLSAAPGIMVAELAVEDTLQTASAAHFPLVTLNAAAHLRCLHLTIKQPLSMPIHLLSLQTNMGVTHVQHRIDIAANLELIVLEETVSLNQDAISNQVMQIEIAENSQLHYFKIAGAKQIATYFTNQLEKSCSSFTNLMVESLFARDEIIVELNAPFAKCYTRGFYRLAHLNQYADNHIEILHHAADTSSEMFYKGIIDQNAKAVFNGRLLVAKNAQRIQAEQTNHNLLLSSKAEVYTKPELEIYADDVRCKHGASVGQLDEEALFYLQARGIDKEEAIKMILIGFAEDILATIRYPQIRARFAEVLNAVA